LFAHSFSLSPHGHKRREPSTQHPDYVHTGNSLNDAFPLVVSSGQ
jgi:hypothetical protein